MRKVISWEFKNPQGIVVVTDSLKALASSNKLNRHHLSNLASGNRKTHKGWTFYKITTV